MNSKQQLKGKLGQVAHIDVWLCCNSGSKSLFFQKSRTWSVSAILIRLVDPKIGKAMHLKRRNQKKIQYNKIQKNFILREEYVMALMAPLLKYLKRPIWKYNIIKGALEIKIMISWFEYRSYARYSYKIKITEIKIHIKGV